MTKSEPIPLPEEKPFVLNEVIRLHLNELDYSTSELARIVNLHKQEFEHRFIKDERPKLRVLRNVS